MPCLTFDGPRAEARLVLITQGAVFPCRTRNSETRANLDIPRIQLRKVPDIPHQVTPIFRLRLYQLAISPDYHIQIIELFDRPAYLLRQIQALIIAGNVALWGISSDVSCI